MQEMKVLNISQPFAHFVVWGDKNVENRSRNSRFRGTILIYASKTKRNDNFEDQPINAADCECGSIIGMDDLVDCIGESEVTEKTDEWFMGSLGYVLENRVGFKVPIPVLPPSGAVTWWSLTGDNLAKVFVQAGTQKIVPITNSAKKPKILKFVPNKNLSIIIGERPVTMSQALSKFVQYCHEFDIEFDPETGIVKADKDLEAAFGMASIDMSRFKDLIASKSKKCLK